MPIVVGAAAAVGVTVVGIIVVAGFGSVVVAFDWPRADFARIADGWDRIGWSAAFVVAAGVGRSGLGRVGLGRWEIVVEQRFVELELEPAVVAVVADCAVAGPLPTAAVDPHFDVVAAAALAVVVVGRTAVGGEEVDWQRCWRTVGGFVVVQIAVAVVLREGSFVVVAPPV